MNNEEITRKSIFMTGFRSKLGYIFNGRDLEEVEFIIDFYEQKVNQLETNRDEVIEFINSQSPYAGVCGKTIRTILERGKE